MALARTDFNMEAAADLILSRRDDFKAMDKEKEAARKEFLESLALEREAVKYEKQQKRAIIKGSPDRTHPLCTLPTNHYLVKHDDLNAAAWRVGNIAAYTRDRKHILLYFTDSAQLRIPSYTWVPVSALHWPDQWVPRDLPEVSLRATLGLCGFLADMMGNEYVLYVRQLLLSWLCLVRLSADPLKNNMLDDICDAENVLFMLKGLTRKGLSSRSYSLVSSVIEMQGRHIQEAHHLASADLWHVLRDLIVGELETHKHTINETRRHSSHPLSLAERIQSSDGTEVYSIGDVPTLDHHLDDEIIQKRRRVEEEGGDPNEVIELRDGDILAYRLVPILVLECMQHLRR